MTATTATTATTVVDSPVGRLTLLAIDGSLAGLYMDDQRHRPPEEYFGPPHTELADARLPDAQLLAEATRQLEEYFDRRRTTFDLPLAPVGTPFRQAVWAALRTIPYGETASYGEIADQLGQPGAARAVGAANGRNPIGIVIPCHRVVGASGGLTGYGGGLERKRFLLALEQSPAARDERLFYRGCASDRPPSTTSTSGTPTSARHS
jgi:methylated-DNA-[protein]-cysteine S-methyltransferase